MAAARSVTLAFEPIEAVPLVRADRTRLVQILVNLGSNAIKHNRPGGHATFSARIDGEVARVAVRDDGIGIPLDEQDRLFQPFQRAGQENGGVEADDELASPRVDHGQAAAAIGPELDVAVAETEAPGLRVVARRRQHGVLEQRAQLLMTRARVRRQPNAATRR